MCGIVGYIGRNQAVPFLINGLEKLEYRGYDSSGIAIYTEDGIEVIRKKGRLKILKDIIEEKPEFKSYIGIGHTRWATHGEPSDVNSHPHMSESGRIAVVHNGIIENYISLKNFLIEKGKNFASDTDTEVIVQLIDYMYDGDIKNTIIQVTKKLKGSYALAVMCAQEPEKLIAVKKDSPLIIGVGEDENYIASDIPALLSKTRDIYRMKEKEIAVITSDNIEIYDEDGNCADKKITKVNWDVDSSEKGEYQHYMLKEIMEQPKVIKSTISPHIENGKISFENIGLNKTYLESVDKIYIIACGSAYHAGYTGKYVIESIARKPVEVDLASEFRYKNPMVDDKTLVISISQSGETADTLAAMREAKKLGAKVLSIVNVVGSSIANEADYVIYTLAGPEIAVATTKAYSAQLAVLYMLALYMAETFNTISEEQYKEYIKELTDLSGKVKDLLDNIDEIKELAKNYAESKDVFFIGRTIDYTVCMEGSLKLKEISYIHSEAYAAGELKHGTISLIEEGTLVIACATQEKLFDKTVSNIREVKARGAKTLIISSKDKKQKSLQVADSVALIPKTCDIMSPSVSTVVLQIFSYYVALAKGCDIDKPRNLAKSVTVE